MKKSLLLTLALFVLAAGASIGAISHIGKGAEDFTVSEKVLCGDRSAAEGLHVIWKSTCIDNYHLSWDTEYDIEKEVVSNTKFQFSQKDDRDRSFMWDETVTWYFGVDMAVSGTSISIQDNPNLLAVEPVLDAVMKKTPDGSCYTEQLYLKDYLSYYPVYFDYHDFLYHENIWSPETDEYHILQDYFKIPVKEDHVVEVTVEKDSSGELVGVELQTVSGGPVEIYTDYQIAEDGIYLLLAKSAVQTDTEALSDEEMMSGIYYLPFCVRKDVTIIGSGRAVTIDSDQIIRICSLESDGGSNSSIRLTEDESRILLYSREKGNIVLKVFDTKTGKEVQNLNLLREENASEEGISGEEDEESDYGEIYVYMGQDFQTVYTLKGQFAVLTLDGQGNYQKEFDGSFWEDEKLDSHFSGVYPYSSESMDYQNGKLVRSTFTDTGASRIAVYDTSGLLYLGHYGLESIDSSVVNGIGGERIIDNRFWSQTVQWTKQES